MDPELYNHFLFAIAVIFAVSFILTSYRILAGPNSIDRLLGMDGLAAMLQCAFATYICFSLDSTISNAMIVIALVGFISTVSITRFRKRDEARS
ncbi:cation:proton antiporter [Corynebacterium sp. sy017]|uniref:monovalent cation/H+ antiporter complex subunit F n=1 Tax=unclassified Corynebacterium TaxID=2624378 RepID=UPI001185D562|nr:MULTISPECIES: monovalent cation/H+ antiporter complex subunit F [unclassified Corynebacterium]MBP3088454.1 cation:proton antiporter [Corynebacterium sp. sy017]QDZ41889.1 cation:proton antiporter [Corynebacterium sp. sy039]TSD91763.1 cation:proton antiporter [Corynebacterium sp. SY003]